MPYTPTITVNSTPAVQVDMAGALTYLEFLNSLGNWNYQVKEFYIRANSNAQINEPINYNIYDVTGQRFNQVINVEIDPYQHQPAQMVNVKQLGILLNGQSSLSFNLLPGEQILIILYTNVIAIGGVNMLQQSGNLKEGDDLLGNLKLYDTTRVYPIRGISNKCIK